MTLATALLHDRSMETRIGKLEMAADDTRERLTRLEVTADDARERLTRLEIAADDTGDRLTKIETRLDTFATKEDLHRELHAMTWKIFGACTFLVAATFFIARIGA